jgi:LPXTG-motif cell wall-anchored protein
MNNRRNLKEDLTISNKQRFSIRKFSIGVASVMLGTTLYFMGGVGTSIVHADSVQGQSVQTSNLDTNSAQASSDTSSAEQTSSQNQTSSAQNSQKAVSNASSNTESTDSKTQTSDQVDNATTDKNEASQADNASATNIKTRDNKKVVSDANRAKSTANDAQTKPAQQTAKSDAANSNTLVVQQTKKLTGNAKLIKLADSKAQADTKTDSNYSVTDNYPEGLMTHLPSDFDNKQEYAFEWLRNKNNNNIILTTNRTGDGVVYVYQDGKKVGTYLAQNSSYTLYDTKEDIWGDDYRIEIGTVYNDNFAGIVQSNGYRLNIIYSSHAKDVDAAGSSYSTVSFFVPHKITQTVTYKDSKGNVIDSLTHTQDGLTGQSYTTGLPSGSDYVRAGEYLDNITNNSSGLISEFHDGYTCTKNYHDGVKVTFTENDSEKTGIGTMDYVIYDGDNKVSGSLAYGQSTNYTNDRGRYTIVNPYVPQTTNIIYQYKKLGNVVNKDPKGTTTTQYTNDPNDPTKVESINVPSIPGYTTLVNGKTVSDKTIMPADPGQDTTITYSANDQSTTAKFVDDDNKGAQVGDTVTLNGKTDQTINTGLEVPVHYELAKDQTIPATYTFKANGNEPIVIHLVHAKKADQNDNNLNKIVTRTINVTNPDGKTNTIKQVAHLRRSGTIDEVTQKATYTPWTTDNWAEYDTPQISGYTPSQAKVSATTVDGNTQDQTVTITYSADKQKASVTYMDDKTGKTLKVDNLNGVTNAKSGYTTKAAIDTYTGLGYTLVSDDTNGNEVVFDNDDANDQAFTVHLSHGTITVTPENPGKPGEPVDPDNPDGPKYPDGTEEYQVKRTGTQTIHYVGAGDKTPADNKQTFIFTREITFDNVTGKIISVTPWNVKSHTFGSVDTPIIPGYHADKAVAGGATVTPDDLNNVITVTYIPDGGNGDNPGSNGGGDQDDTPTPEPTSDNQPDTKLPSDNNTDKDVEKDKQDKPEEVKKARKIIKTRITKQEHIGNAEKAEPLAEQEHNDQTVASPVKNEANEPQLPQTGEANTSVIGLLGMLVAGFAAILGFESSRSRKHKN